MLKEEKDQEEVVKVRKCGKSLSFYSAKCKNLLIVYYVIKSIDSQLVI